MIITDIKTFLLKEWRPMLFVIVETDAGITGIGEGGISNREHAADGMVQHLKSLLIGTDPATIEHHWQTMWRGGFHPSGQILSSAIAAIDIALWDIKGKALGTPVYNLLGGRTRDRVLTYCHLHGETPVDILAEARKKVAEGWKCLRFEPSYGSDLVMDGRRAVDRAVEEFRLLRAELGPGIELAFDAHTRLTPTEAALFCREVEPFRPMFIEDPLRSEFPEGYALLRQQTAVPLAAGEQFATKWMFRDLIERNLIDYARIDVCIAGGLTESRKITAMAETHMIDIAVHNPIGPVSTAACLHLNLASPNVLVQELPRRPGDSLGDLITTDQLWEDGWLTCEGRPGIGVEFHPEFLRNYPYSAEQMPILKRIDGSFANW